MTLTDSNLWELSISIMRVTDHGKNLKACETA